MIAWLGRLLAPVALKLLAGLAIAAAVAAVLLRARHAGRTAERVEQLQRAVTAAQEARRIEDEVRRVDPAARRDRLRFWASGG